MTATLHKLTAGDGYQYLIRQVAVVDQTLEGPQSLADYYSEKGEQPGAWLGTGLIGLTGPAGVAAGDTVTAEQMKALFGEGRHPNAEALEAAARVTAAAQGLNARGIEKAMDQASKLGRKFNTRGEPSEFLVEVARAYEAFNVARGCSRSAAIEEGERAKIRTRIGRELFEKQYGRKPSKDSGELDGFIHRESRPRTQACAGYDLTFSPVKSVSTLWAIADLDTSKEIQAGHEAAVRDTLKWLEREVIFARRGTNGVRTVDVEGLIAAAFTHRDSRGGDPDLHTHVAISNKVRDAEDGAWLAVDGTVLHKFMVAASERYNTRLEAELTRRLGVSWTTVKDPRERKRSVREIAGIDAGLMSRWSSRRRQVENRLSELTSEFQADHGRVPTPKEALALAQQANLDTREAKRPHRSWEDQRAQWQAEAIEHLGDAGRLEQMQAAALAAPQLHTKRLTETEVQAVAEAALATVEGARARFQVAHVRAEVERRVKEAEVAYDEVDSTVDRAVATALELATAVTRSRGEVPQAMRRRNGTSQYEKPGAQLFTTARVLDAEQRIVDAAHDAGGRKATEFDVAVGMLTETANGINLNAGQRHLVHAMVTSGARVQLGLAPAGTGKTTAMRALSTAWTNSGGTVLALAPTAVAAAELSNATGATADTLDALIVAWNNNAGDLSETKFSDLDESTLIVVDEAGMAATPRLAALVEIAYATGASVRLVGDDQQLAAIGAGGVLRDIASAAGAESLTEVVRFRTAGEAAASLALRDGKAEEAIGFYLDNSRVRATSAMRAADDLYDAWVAERAAGRSCLMIASTNDQVNELNARARFDRLAGTDQPVGKTVALHSGLEASTGDLIVTRNNDRRLRTTTTDFVKNGDRWRIEGVTPDGALDVAHEQSGRRIRLPASYVEQQVDLAYATTSHGAQGQTVETGLSLVTGDETRQQQYVNNTRGAKTNVMFVVIGGDGDTHNSIRPDQVAPRTAAEVLEKVFARDGSAVSATTTIREDQAAEARLVDHAGVYVDAVRRAVMWSAGAEVTQRLAGEAEQRVPGVTSTPAWEFLHAHLAQLHLQGQDPAAALEQARDQRSLDGANDAASLLLWRLTRGAQPAGPLPWMPAIPEVLEDAELTAWLAGEAQAVTEAAEELRTEAQAWTPETAPAWAQRVLGDTNLVADLAVWRAARGIATTDLRPAGSKPSERAARSHYTALDKRITAARAHLTTSADWWAPMVADHERLTEDPWWSVLAQRLDDLATDPSWLTPDLVDQLAPEEPETDSTESPAPVEPVTAAAIETGERDVRSVETGDDGRAEEDRELHARIVDAHRAAATFYRDQVEGSWVPAYLREERGLVELLDRGVGYAPRGRRTLVDHLAGHGYDEELLITAGLALRRDDGTVTDRFRDRMMFPVTVTVPGEDGAAEPVAFVGRANPQAAPGVPKYLNTSSTPAYIKGEVLYGLAEHADLLRAGAVPVIVEGVLDAEAITLSSGGRAVGLAPGGTAFTEAQVAALGEVCDLPTTPVVMGTDSDEPGQKAAARGWQLLVDAGVTDPRAASFGAHKDPAALREHEGSDAVAEAVTSQTTPLIGRVVEHELTQWANVLDHIDGQLGAVRALAPKVAQASTEQQAYATARIMASLQLDADLIVDELQGSGDIPGDSTESPGPVVEQVPELRTAADAVEALINHVLTEPLPAEHPAGATWSRIAALTATTAQPGENSPERQLLDRVPVTTAARIAATPQWPTIAALATEAEHEGRASQLAEAIDPEELGHYATPEVYAQELLDRLSPSPTGDAPRGQEAVPTTGSDQALEELRARLESARRRTENIAGPTPNDETAQDPRRDPPPPVQRPRGPRM